MPFDQRRCRPGRILSKSCCANGKRVRKTACSCQQCSGTAPEGFYRKNYRKAARPDISDKHFLVLFHGEGSLDEFIICDCNYKHNIANNVTRTYDEGLDHHKE